VEPNIAQSLAHTGAQLDATRAGQTYLHGNDIRPAHLGYLASFIDCLAHCCRCVCDSHTKRVRRTSCTFTQHSISSIEDDSMCLCTTAIDANDYVLRTQAPRGYYIG
jgi:hypothetical protein